MFDKRPEFSEAASPCPKYASSFLQNQPNEYPFSLRAEKMKFLLSNGKHLKDKILDFPVAKELYSSKLLVACVDAEGKVVAACGMRSPLNILNLYVKEGYRRQGVGGTVLAESIEAARRRRLGFITLTVSADNLAATHLYRKFGFREIIFLGQSRQVLMMLSLSLRGKISFCFFRTLRLLLPSTFWSYVHSWVYRRTLPNAVFEARSKFNDVGI